MSFDMYLNTLCREFCNSSGLKAEPEVSPHNPVLGAR